MGIDWFNLAEAAAEAVSQVIVVVFCGVLLTKAGLLSPQTQRGLSKINLYFLTPCLIFTKIASALNWDRFITFWPIPLIYFSLCATNWTIAQIGSRLLRLSREETRFATASIMFFNNNSLPIALVQSLAMSGAAKLLLRDEDDTAEAVLARGVSYILFTSVFDNLVRWSFGLNLLSHHKGDETNGKDDGSSSNDNDDNISNSDSAAPVAIAGNEQGDVIIDVDSHPAPHVLPESTANTVQRTWTSRIVAVLKKARGLLQPPLVTAIVALIVGLIQPLHHLFMDPDSKVFIFLIKPLDTCGRAAVPMILLCLGAQVLSFDSAPSTALPAMTGSSLETASASSTTANSSRAPTPYGTTYTSEPQYSHDINNRRGSNSSSSSSTSGNSNESSPLLSHSTTGATISAQKSTEDQPQHPHRHDHHLELGSHNNKISSTNIHNHKTNNNNKSVPFILFCRMFLSPLLTLPAILLIPNSISPALLGDPIFRLTMVMLSASPTAVNMMQICQINGFFEKKMARLLFWSYCVVGVPGILIWVMVALQASTWGRQGV
ncbi:MAG: membrane transport protein-domain-containing protein [Linnemannia gamsii]|nr:MAG: membrane transport protein-domain-containing protein [Linnemannia gamsii]